MAANKNMHTYEGSVKQLREVAAHWRKGPPDTPLNKQPGTVFDRIPFSTENDLYGAFEKQLKDAPKALVSESVRNDLRQECVNRRKEFDKDLDVLKLLRFNTMVQQVEEYAYNKIKHPERAKVENTMLAKLENPQQTMDELVDVLQFDEVYFGAKSPSFYGFLNLSDTENIIDTLQVKESKHVGELYDIVQKSVKEDKEKGLWPPQQYGFSCDHYKGNRRETDKFSARTQSLLEQCGDLSQEDMQFGIDMYNRNFADKDFDEIFINGKSVNEFCIDKDMNPTDEEKMCLVTAHALDPKSKVDFRRFDPERPDKRSIPVTLKPEISPETVKYGFFGSAIKWLTSFRNKEKHAEAWADMRAALKLDPNPKRNESYAEDISSGNAKKRRDDIVNNNFVDRRTIDDLLQEAVKDFNDEPKYKSLYTLKKERMENIKEGALLLAPFDKTVDGEAKRIEKDMEHARSEITFPGKNKKAPRQTLNDESCRTMGALCRLGMASSMHNPYGTGETAENAKKDSMKKLGESLGPLLKIRETKGSVTDKDITDKQANAIADDVVKLMRNANSLKMPDVDLTDPLSIAKHYDQLNRLSEYGTALNQLHDSLPPKVVKAITQGDKKNQPKALPGELTTFMKTVDNLKTLSIIDPAMQVRGMSDLVIGAKDASPAKEVLDHRDTVDKIYISQKLCRDLNGGFQSGKLISDLKVTDPYDADIKSDELLIEARKNKHNPDTAKERTDMLENICLNMGRTQNEYKKKQDDWLKEKANTDKHMEDEKKTKESEQKEREEKERIKKERKENSIKNAAAKKANRQHAKEQAKVKLPSEKNLDGGEHSSRRVSNNNVQRQSGKINSAPQRGSKNHK
jgi:hypothetical protein